MSNNPHSTKIMAMLSATDGNVLDEESTESMRALIRICTEVSTFLNNHEAETFPSSEEARYIAGTIRSGFDCFFEIHFLGESCGFDYRAEKTEYNQNSFAELCRAYKTIFSRAFEGNVGYQEFFVAIVALWRIKFSFLANVL